MFTRGPATRRWIHVSVLVMTALIGAKPVVAQKPSDRPAERIGGRGQTVVILVNPAQSEPLVARLEAELSSVGIKVRRFEAQPGADFETIVAAAMAGGASAAIRVIPRSGGTEVWTSDTTARVLRRRSINAEPSDAAALSVLAFRTVEFLRASLLDVPKSRLRTQDAGRGGSADGARGPSSAGPADKQAPKAAAPPPAPASARPSAVASPPAATVAPPAPRGLPASPAPPAAAVTPTPAPPLPSGAGEANAAERRAAAARAARRESAARSPETEPEPTTSTSIDRRRAEESVEPQPTVADGDGEGTAASAAAALPAPTPGRAAGGPAANVAVGTGFLVGSSRLDPAPEVVLSLRYHLTRRWSTGPGALFPLSGQQLSSAEGTSSSRLLRVGLLLAFASALTRRLDLQASLGAGAVRMKIAGTDPVHELGTTVWHWLPTGWASLGPGVSLTPWLWLRFEVGAGVISGVYVVTHGATTVAEWGPIYGVTDLSLEAVF